MVGETALKRKYSPKICSGCGKEFFPNVGTQIYCGSKTHKSGCSYKNTQRIHKKKGERYRGCPKRAESMRKYQREWRKEQRKSNSAYAERQKESKREFAKSPKGKEQSKKARIRNIKAKLNANRKRQLRKRYVIGSHTEQQWQSLKVETGNKCSFCHIPEDHLQNIYGGKVFQKLTKDHIIPLSKGGTDFIENIQPACVSCNASKNNSIHDDIVCVSGGFDMLHVGHVKLIQDAAQYGKVIVILNSDDWLLRKKGYTFHPSWEDRARIVYAMRGVIGVSAVDDSDGTVCEAIGRIRPKFFANGGDRGPENTPELKLCNDLQIRAVFNIGGEKIQSSSELVKKARKHD